MIYYQVVQECLRDDGYCEAISERFATLEDAVRDAAHTICPAYHQILVTQYETDADGLSHAVRDWLPSEWRAIAAQMEDAK